MRASSHVFRGALPILTAGLVIGAWQLWVRLGHVQSWILPSPSSVASAGWSDRNVLISNAWTTGKEAAVGLLCGAVIGIVIAIALSATPLLRRALWPLIVTSQTIPIIVLAPIMAVWFGYGIMPKVVLVALISFFPVVVAAASGIASAQVGHIELLRSFGAGKWAILRFVELPAAIVPTIAGIRIAAAYALGSAVIGEFVGGNAGLGIYIDQSHRSYRTDQMLAAVVVIAILSVAAFTLVGLVGRVITPWIPPHQNPNERKSK